MNPLDFLRAIVTARANNGQPTIMEMESNIYVVPLCCMKNGVTMALENADSEDFFFATKDSR